MVTKNWNLYEDLTNRSAYLESQPIAVAAHSNAWVCGRSHAEI